MKKILLSLLFVFFASIAFSQEYDDMYFNRNDRVKVRKHTKHQKQANLKSVNPEYLERYTYRETATYNNYSTTTYNRIRPHHYRNWSFNVHWNYYWGWNNYYSWYPYHYDPFFMTNTYYSWHYPYYTHFSWHRPYYGWGWNYYPHHNYYYGNTYYTKTYVTKQYNNVKYGPRKTSRSSTYVPRTNQRVTESKNIRIPRQEQTRDTYKSSKSRSNSIYMNRPSRQTNRSTGSSTYQRSRSNTYTPSRSYSPSRSSTPSRSYTPSRSTPSRSYSPAPSRSSGSSGSRSSSGGSRSSGRRQ